MGNLIKAIIRKNIIVGVRSIWVFNFKSEAKLIRGKFKKWGTLFIRKNYG